MAELRLRLNRIGVRIAADESVRKVTDPLAVAQAHAADLLVVKAAPLGGIARALEIVQQSGLPAVVSSALETSVGLSMGLHLAAALPDRAGGQLAAGLGTATLLAQDITDDPLLPVNGQLQVRRVAPSAAKLEQLAATPERRDWWLARLERCLRLL
jgi:O-succinylbenzoate synthase